MTKLRSLKRILSITSLSTLLSFSPGLLLPDSTPVANAQSSTLSNYLGTWHGKGAQNGSNSNWSIRVAIQQAGGQGMVASSIDYPSLSCGGQLSFAGADGQNVVFRESLNYGRQNCTDGGIVQLSALSSEQLAYHWFYANGSLGGSGILYRSGY